jgi:hypothetical protein
MNTNFITPPDFVDEGEHSVLVVDADPSDIQSLALVCANHNHTFNVYLYNDEMQNLEWLVKAAGVVDAIIVNTEENSLSPVKDTLAALPKAKYYGTNEIDDSKYCTVIEYFINYSDNNQHTTTNTL